MKIDLIEKPRTFWYEDKEGNQVPFDWNKGFPDSWHAQYSKGVLVQETICFGNQKKGKDLWPVRFLKWLLYLVPSSWKKPTAAMTFNSTINSNWIIIKYLKEHRGFNFNDACIVSSDLCGRCIDICEAEITETAPQEDYKVPNIMCKYCQVIDPEYIIRRRIWSCYRTLKLEGDISKAYKEISPNSREGYFKENKCVS